jgi:hypothetical protein
MATARRRLTSPSALGADRSVLGTAGPYPRGFVADTSNPRRPDAHYPTGNRRGDLPPSE